jgi:hypothetical protein
MTLKELEPQLLALSDNEKIQVVQLLSQHPANLIQGEQYPYPVVKCLRALVYIL